MYNIPFHILYGVCGVRYAACGCSGMCLMLCDLCATLRLTSDERTRVPLICFSQ